MANDIVRKKALFSDLPISALFFGLYSIPSLSLTSSIE